MQLYRTTFHDFMLNVHARLHRHERTADPLTLVAQQLMGEFRVLCLDEFFVTDVADATMLNRLFSQMWDRGLVFVATSNRCSLWFRIHRSFQPAPIHNVVLCEKSLLPGCLAAQWQSTAGSLRRIRCAGRQTGCTRMGCSGTFSCHS